MHIDIYLDTICPWCFIGKRRVERALAARPEVPTQLRWRAFLLNPAMPATGLDRQTYLALKFGGNARADHLYDMIADSGRSAGIDFDFSGIDRTPNSLDSHRLIMFAEDHGLADAIVESLFQAYFLFGVDIGDRERLIDIGITHGLAEPELRDYIESDSNIDAVRAQDLRARRMGIDGVPCFIINERYAIAGAQESEAFLPLFDVPAAVASA